MARSDDSSVPARVPGRLTRFTSLWCRLFTAIVLLASVEGLVLYHSGFQYKPQASFFAVSVATLSIDSTGTWAAAKVKFRRNNIKGSVWNDVVLVDLRQQHLVPLELGHLQPECVALSPDAKSLAMAGADGSIIFVDNPTSGIAARKRWLARSNDGDITRLVFSPDGRKLAATGQGLTHVWEWPSGTLLHQRPHDGDAFGVFTFSADSQHVLSADQSGELCIWDIATGKVNDSFLKAGKRNGEAHPSFDGLLVGKRVATPPLTGDLAIANVDSVQVSVHSHETGRELWHARSSTLAVALEQQGRLLAHSVFDQGHYRICVHLTADGRPLCDMESDDTFIMGLAFAPDDVLYSWDKNGVIRAWNVEQQRQQWSLSLLEWASDRETNTDSQPSAALSIVRSPSQAPRYGFQCPEVVARPIRRGHN